jgi:hypothetical protein
MALARASRVWSGRTSEFVFERLAERANAEDLDDHLFRLSELPSGSVAQILETIRGLGHPTSIVWVPVWLFGSDDERRRAEQTVDQILSQRRNMGVVVYSPQDMVAILGCWEIDQDTPQDVDWFSALGLLRRESPNAIPILNRDRSRSPRAPPPRDAAATGTYRAGCDFWPWEPS